MNGFFFASEKSIGLPIKFIVRKTDCYNLSALMGRWSSIKWRMFQTSAHFFFFSLFFRSHPFNFTTEIKTDALIRTAPIYSTGNTLPLRTHTQQQCWWEEWALSNIRNTYMHMDFERVRERKKQFSSSSDKTMVKKNC